MKIKNNKILRFLQQIVRKYFERYSVASQNEKYKTQELLSFETDEGNLFQNFSLQFDNTQIKMEKNVITLFANVNMFDSNYTFFSKF